MSFIRKDGTFFNAHPAEDLVELPENLLESEIYRRFAVEIWSDSPAKEGARFIAEETFEKYPTDNQLYWCFAKYGDSVLRIKEERYLGVPKHFIPDSRKYDDKA